MIHIVKQRQEPINAMIRSKEGKIMAMVTITSTTRTRTLILAA